MGIADAFTGAIVAVWTAITFIYLLFHLTTIVVHPKEHLPGIGHDVQWIPIYAHSIAAVLIIIFGPVQILTRLFRYHKMHRVTGVIYLNGCFFTSAFGLAYIILNGTSGGLWMSIPFGITGILTLIETLLVGYLAVRDPKQHRDWVVRLYALAASPVLYRLQYIIAEWIGCISCGSGSPIDRVFNWTYFIIPMIVAEVYVVWRKRNWTCNGCCVSKIVLESSSEQENLIGEYA